MKKLLLLVAALLFGSRVARALSGEDPVFGHPWYHEKITREAAKNLGFTFNPQRDAPDVPLGSVAAEIAALAKDDPRRPNDGAAEAIAWHADYLDSYLYSPIWWAAGKNKDGKGGPEGVLKRYKVSRAVEQELKNCHFDDLFSSDKVNAMWRRYASGTYAGLMWAADHDDVYAAQNVLGASLHAMEDFYSHSSWIDKPERRNVTYFQYPRAQSLSDNLFTGAYEHDHQLGVKSHGKWIPQNAVWGLPGVKEIMEVACDPLSPYSNSDECAAYKEVRDGTSMHPTIGGVKLPDSIMVYTPAGIAIDNKWAAGEAVKQRGIADQVTGPQAFNLVYGLAVKQATQWLQTLETTMKKTGHGDFWQKIKTTPASDAQRQSQYENYGQFPFLFMAAGPYPPANANSADEWYLRVKLHTAEGATGGTDSDIRLRAGGQTFLLDYLHGANPILNYNDFEAGDNDAYVVGPFAQCPDKLDLINDAASGQEIFEALGRDFVSGVKGAIDTVGDLLLDVVGGHADKIAVNKQLWMPTDLATMPLGGAGQGFQIPLNGGKEGNYLAHGTIFKVAQDEANYSFEVHLDSLKCIKESTWDRGSNSDEPFLLCALNPLPGDQQRWLSPVYNDVDTGEQPVIDHGFARVSVPKSSGMLNLALTLMESDDENAASRQGLLDKFAEHVEDGAKVADRRFTEALATTLASNWKLADIEVTAWSRNGRVRQGTVLSQNANRWIESGTFASFPLDVSKARDTGISTDDLLPFLNDKGNAPHESSPVPTNPTPHDADPLPTNPLPSPSFDLTTWVDEWQTSYGRVKLTLNNGVLSGRFYVLDQFGREKEDGMLELRADGAGDRLIGFSNYANGDKIPLSLSLNEGKNTFAGLNRGVDKWSGQRLRAAPVPTVPTTPQPTVPVVTRPVPTIPVPTIPTVPTTPQPTIPTVPTTPTTGTSGATSGFRPLGNWGVQIESTRIARDNQVEVVANLKNISRQRQTLGAGDFTLILTDSDGVGITQIGNLYRAGGDPDMKPDKFPGSAVESGSPLRVLWLFDLPEGETPLQTLTIYGNNPKPLTFNIAGLTLPAPTSAATFPIPGAVGAQSAFAPMNEFGVRFDGARRDPNGALQLFVTVKNLDAAKIRSHPGFSLDVAVIDADGLTHKDEGNLYRASGGALGLIKTRQNVILVPGGAATLCYPVPLPNGAVPKQVLIKYNDKSLTITLPAVP